MSEVEKRVRAEVEALHRFLVGWFSGALAEAVFETAFADRLDPELVFIAPAGSVLGRPVLLSAVRDGYGSNPDFRIAIRNVRVHRVLGDKVIATYEEWQRNALSSTPPDNARVATVVMDIGGTPRWLHIHETWLPDAVALAGPYVF